MSQDQSVADTVRGIVAEILALEPEEVMPDSRFFADLGGESIDLLDLQFQLEKQLRARVDFSRALAAIETDSEGHITPASLRRLDEQHPFLGVGRLSTPATPTDLLDLLTTRSIVAFVERALEAPPLAAGQAATEAT